MVNTTKQQNNRKFYAIEDEEAAVIKARAKMDLCLTSIEIEDLLREISKWQAKLERDFALGLETEVKAGRERLKSMGAVLKNLEEGLIMWQRIITKMSMPIPGEYEVVGSAL